MTFGLARRFVGSNIYIQSTQSSFVPENRWPSCLGAAWNSWLAACSLAVVFFLRRASFISLCSTARGWRSARRNCGVYILLLSAVGMLFFDVGAYMGFYSELFTELGARVIAVEPNPSCYEGLTVKARSRNMFVERCAAGDAPGIASLFIFAWKIQRSLL